METSFGNWVRRRRKGLDLTQDELARRVGCSSSLIYKIETDERRPSRQIAELLADQLKIGTDQRDLFLKVARQELAVFRLDEPEAMGDVPPPAQPGSAPAPVQPAVDIPVSRNIFLPVFPTIFIGREHEIDIVSHQLLDPACRMLTLTGPGGVGKTRLAVEVARRLETAFADGIYFLAMVGVDSPDSILPAVADALGLVFSGPADPKLQLIQALNKKTILLIFDNMEHLISGGSLLADILEQSPGIRVMLTSREPVHLQWEWVFEVQGLPVPEVVRPGVLETNSATALFLQRTRQALQQVGGNPQGHPPHESSWQDWQAIVQICQLVDGLPLAIELAASWARVMTPQEIAGELERGLDLLETTLQDVPARHRSIRLVFDHSWKLLTEEERTSLMKLAVFPGGFTREAAQSVAGASVALLSALVSKSLLRYTKKAGRYDFHELVRQYALVKLHELAELEHSTHNLHAEFFARWVGNLETSIKSARQIETSTLLRNETANWSAAWRWAARTGQLDLLRQMEPCLYWFYEIHGDNAQAVASISYAVNELRLLGAPENLATDRQKATMALLIDQLGWFHFRTGNTELAFPLFKESLDLAKEMTVPDPEALYYINVNWGYTTLITGDLDTSEKMTRESLHNALSFNGHWHAAIAVNILGIIELQRGNLTQAYQQLSNSLQRWREVGDLRGLVFCIVYLSMAAIALGDLEEAEALLKESNAIAQKKLDRWAQAAGLDLLGHIAISRGEMETAAEHFRQSMVYSQEIGDQWAATQALIHLGEVQLALKDEPGAKLLFRQAYENARQANWLPTILEVLTAALDSYEELPIETRLAASMAVLSNSAASLQTRQRASRLRDRLAALLNTQRIKAAESKAEEKPAEQWAYELLKGLAIDNRTRQQPALGLSAESNLI